MSAYKEIVTKAVVGKGKKYYKNTYTIDTDNVPTTVLGCWVINHKFKGTEVNDKIVITGSFDVNIWYSYDNDTKTTVITKKITYSETVMVRQRETTDSSTKDIVVRSLKQPSCINAKENGKTISIDIEKELGIEVVGDTKIKVAIEEDEEPWDLIEDTEYTEEVDKEIDNSIKEEYLKENYLQEKDEKKEVSEKE
jgi:spore coat protein E